MVDSNSVGGLATLSSRQIREILKQQVAAEKAAREEEQAVLHALYAEAGDELFAAVFANTDTTDKDDSQWAGKSVRGIPVTIDGHAYTVSLTMTDVARTTEKKAALEAEAQAFLAKQAEQATASSTEG